MPIQLPFWSRRSKRRRRSTWRNKRTPPATGHGVSTRSLERLEDRICLSTDNWINPTGGNWDVAANWSTGAVPGVFDNVTINTAGAATITIQSGDTVAIEGLTTAGSDTLMISGGSLTLGGNSTLSGPLAMTGGSLTASGVGVTVTADGATSLNGALSAGDVHAQAGATLALPQLTSYKPFGNTFEADGTGSVLDVSALTALSLRGDFHLNATSGGEIKLTGITSLSSSSEGSVFVTDTRGSTIVDPNLTTLDGLASGTGGGVFVTLDGDPHVADAWTQFIGGLLDVQGGSYTLPGLADIDRSTIYVSNGASLALPRVQSYAYDDAGFNVAGTNSTTRTASVLDLSALTSVTGAGTAPSLSLYASQGGVLNLSGLTSLDGGTHGSIQETGGGEILDGKLATLNAVYVTVDGTDPHLADSWTKFTNGDLTVNGGSYTLPSLSDFDGSSLTISNGATLALPKLTSYTSNENSILVDGTGSTLDLPALASMTGASLYAHEGGEIDLADLMGFTGQVDDNGGTIVDPKLAVLDGVAVTLDGDPHVADSWTKFIGGKFYVQGGSYTLPGLADIDRSTIYVSNGASLALPSVQSYAYDYTGFYVSGTNSTTRTASVLDLSALTSVTGAGTAPSSSLSASQGGVINLAGLTSLDGGDLSASQGGVINLAGLTGLDGGSIQETGGGEILDGKLATLNRVYVTVDGTDPHLADSWIKFTNGGLGITGGSYNLPGLGDVDGSGLFISNGATLALPNLSSYTSASDQEPNFFADGSFTTLDLSALASFTPAGNAELYAKNGGKLNLASLTTLASPAPTTVLFPVQINDTGGSTIVDPKLAVLERVGVTLDGDPHVADAWTKFTDGSLSITGGSYNLPGLGDVDGSGLSVSNKGTLSLPAIITDSGSNLNAASGGVLSLPNLTGYTTGQFGLSADGAGSTLALPALTSVDYLDIGATNAGTVDLNRLTALPSAPASVNFRILDTGNSTIVDPNITSLDGGSVKLDGTDQHVADSWTKLTNSTLAVDRGSASLPGLTDVDGSNLEVSGGGTLSLPAVTAIHASTFNEPPNRLSADGTGSVLDLSHLTSVSTVPFQYPYGQGQAQELDVSATNGGEVKLSGLASLTGPTKDTYIRTEHPGTSNIVDASAIQITDTGGGTILDRNLSTLSGVTVTLDGSDPHFTDSWTSFDDSALDVAGGSFRLPAFTEVNGSDLSASNGGALEVQASTSFTGTTILRASGARSTLTLVGTSYVEPTDGVALVVAWAGGTVNMSTLTSISGGAVALRSEGANSVIDLAALQSFPSSGGGAAATNGGSIQSSVTFPAAPDVWINGGSESWVDGSFWGPLGGASFDSWSLGTPPTAGMAVIINTAAPATIDMYDQSISLSSLVLGPSDALTGAGSLVTTGDFTNRGTVTLTEQNQFTIGGSLTNSGTLTVGPGAQVSVGGDATEQASATLNEQISGSPGSGQFGRLAVSGTVTLAGALGVSIASGFSPSVGQDYPIITFGSVRGTFGTVTGLSGAGAALTQQLKPTSLDLIAEPPPPTFTADTPPDAAVGVPYSYRFQANGAAPVSFSASGLPDWARLDSSTGVLSGTPPSAGTFDFTVTAADAAGQDTTANVTWAVKFVPPTFTADAPPAALVGTPYSYQFQAVGTGTSPLVFSATGLPAWATLDASTGVFSGMPLGAGSFRFSVTVSNGIAPDTTVTVTMSVAATLPTSSVAPLPATEPSASFQVSWNGSDAGGPGIATYDVFVSDNGGPFAPFQTATRATTATFRGADGHSYGFYSVATDAAGGRQPTPASAQATTEVATDPNRRYVAAVFSDVLGRRADADGLAFWTAQLDAGMAVSSVAQAIAHSDEYYANFVIQPDYQALLGRAADAGGVKYWTKQMDAGLTDQQLEAGFAASDEFFANAGGKSSPANWIDAIYKLLLGRAADAAGEDYWLGQLNAGVSRGDVALRIANSAENNTQLINDDYFHYLGRAADQGGLAFWLGQFAAGQTNEDVIAGFTGSAEYYRQHSA